MWCVLFVQISRMNHWIIHQECSLKRWGTRSLSVTLLPQLQEVRYKHRPPPILLKMKWTKTCMETWPSRVPVAQFLHCIIGETCQKLNIEKINCRNTNKKPEGHQTVLQKLKGSSKYRTHELPPNVKQFPWQSLFRRFLDGCPQPEAPGKATWTLKATISPELNMTLLKNMKFIESSTFCRFLWGLGWALEIQRPTTETKLGDLGTLTFADLQWSKDVESETFGDSKVVRGLLRRGTGCSWPR